MYLFLDQVTCRNEGSDRPVLEGVSFFARSGDVIAVVAHPPPAASSLLRLIARSGPRDGVLIGSDGTEVSADGDPGALRDWRLSEPYDRLAPGWVTESWRGVSIRRYAFAKPPNDELPDLLLIDDLADFPTFAEAGARRAFVRDLHALHPAPGRRTILYATSDTDDALAVADRVAVLQSGRLVQFGTTAEVYDTPATEFVAQHFGRPAINLFPAILEKDGQASTCGISRSRSAAASRRSSAAMSLRRPATAGASFERGRRAAWPGGLRRTRQRLARWGAGRATRHRGGRGLQAPGARSGCG